MNIGLSAVIIAVVEAIKSLDTTGKITGAWTTLLAIVLGGAAGYFHILGVADITSGIVAGAAAVGVHTVASVVGGK